MDVSAASSCNFAVLQTFRSFLSTSLSICEIKPCSLQPDGHLETCGRGHKVNKDSSHLRRRPPVAAGIWADCPILVNAIIWKTPRGTCFNFWYRSAVFLVLTETQEDRVMCVITAYF